MFKIIKYLSVISALTLTAACDMGKSSYELEVKADITEFEVYGQKSSHIGEVFAFCVVCGCEYGGRQAHRSVVTGYIDIDFGPKGLRLDDYGGAAGIILCAL